MGKLLTAGEAADILGVSPYKVRLLVRHGFLIDRGGHREWSRFRPDDVARLLGVIAAGNERIGSPLTFRDCFSQAMRAAGTLRDRDYLRDLERRVADIRHEEEDLDQDLVYYMGNMHKKVNRDRKLLG